jgi:hypothetical protein
MALVDQILGVESGGDPNATNERSSAGGAGQFIDGTWLSMLQKHRPDLVEGRSRDDLLSLKFDPVLSKEMTAAYAADNGGILSKAGLPVTPGTQYLAHFAGPQGAVGLLRADPSAPAEAVLGARAVAANPFLRGKTAADVAAWADRKMGSQPAAAPTRAPMSLAPPPEATPAPSEQSDKPSEKPATYAYELPAMAALAAPQPSPLMPLPMVQRPKFTLSRSVQKPPFSLRG